MHYTSDCVILPLKIRNAADDGDPRDAPSVPSGVADDAPSPDGHQAREPGRPTRSHRPGGQIGAAPRQGSLGPGRGRVPAGPVRQRRGRSVQAVSHVRAIRARAQDLHRAEPGNDGAEGGARAPAEQVRLLAVAEVPARAGVQTDH